MPVFDWAESPGTSQVLEPRVVSTRFGDGYEQAAPDGLNAVAQVWDVQFDEVEQAVADEIVAFLQPGLGWQRFDWTPPHQTVARKFKCTSLRRSLTGTWNVVNLSARFEQVWEP